MAGRIPDAPPPYGTVVFDCDSTLSAIEGVEALCALVGIDQGEIAELTGRAMDGTLPLEGVYSRRLDRLAPDRTALERLGELYLARALPHARELVDALQRLGKRVHVLSGGLKQAVVGFASALGVPEERVEAVEVFLDRRGAYQGFDELSPLARSGGKLELVRAIARQDRGGGVALVGDGATDLEASPAARRFVAFAGVADRPAVTERAAIVVRSGDLAALLPLLCTPEEIAELESVHGKSALVLAARAAAPAQARRP